MVWPAASAIDGQQPLLVYHPAQPIAMPTHFRQETYILSTKYLEMTLSGKNGHDYEMADTPR
jgi:hypothetical protein